MEKELVELYIKYGIDPIHYKNMTDDLFRLFNVTHRCFLKRYGEVEMRCTKCGYITFRDDDKTTQEIIEQMVQDGYDTPDCSRFGCVL